MGNPFSKKKKIASDGSLIDPDTAETQIKDQRRRNSLAFYMTTYIKKLELKTQGIMFLIRLYLYISICMYVCMCIDFILHILGLGLYTHIYIYTYIHACIHAYLHTYIHTYMI